MGSPATDTQTEDRQTDVYVYVDLASRAPLKEKKQKKQTEKTNIQTDGPLPGEAGLLLSGEGGRDPWPVACPLPVVP